MTDRPDWTSDAQARFNAASAWADGDHPLARMLRDAHQCVEQGDFAGAGLFLLGSRLAAGVALDDARREGMEAAKVERERVRDREAAQTDEAALRERAETRAFAPLWVVRNPRIGFTAYFTSDRWANIFLGHVRRKHRQSEGWELRAPAIRLPGGAAVRGVRSEP